MRNIQEQGNDRGRGGAGVVLLVMRALACSVEVFLHKSSTFGERYLGAQVAVALVILFIFPAFTPGRDPGPLWYFACAFLVACAAIRGGIVRRQRRGELGPHSFYTGTPLPLGRLKETTVKRFFEPVVVWIASAIAGEFSPMLSSYLAIAGVGLLLSVNLTVAAERKRVLDMHDAYMEQRRAAEDWRSMHRE
jgi:hypothetical protein